MKKIISILICVCILAFSLVACCGSGTAEAKVENNYRFEVIRDVVITPSNETYILVDDKTGICYLFVDGYESCTVTVMLDSNGYPLLWED